GAERSGGDLAGGGIYEYDRPSRPWYLGGTFNWWGDRTVRSLRLPSATAIAVQTDWITGCCLLVRGRVFEEIGLLDEGAFLYYEARISAGAPPKLASSVSSFQTQGSTTRSAGRRLRTRLSSATMPREAE